MTTSLTPISILRRPFYAIDTQDFDRGFRRLKFESEALLQRPKDRWEGRIRNPGFIDPAVDGVGRVVEREIIFSGKPGLVYHGTPQLLREPARQPWHGCRPACKAAWFLSQNPRQAFRDRGCFEF